MSLDTFFSGIAVAVSVLSVIFAYLANRRSNNLQERIVNIEEEREEDRLRAQQEANVEIDIESEEFDIKPHQSPLEQYETRYHVTIENNGPSTASDLQLLCNGSPVRPDRSHIEFQNVEKPPDQLEADHSFKFLFRPNFEGPRLNEVALMYENEIGEGQSVRVVP